MLSQLETHLVNHDYAAAEKLISPLYDVFHNQNEVLMTLESLKASLQAHNPDSQKVLNDLKNILVG